LSTKRVCYMNRHSLLYSFILQSYKIKNTIRLLDKDKDIKIFGEHDNIIHEHCI
jgi:hypothetical protein